MRTYQQKTEETQHDWYIVDAAGQRLGTLAVRIARALSGKHKPTWTPHIDDGDHVIVINAEKIELGGNKWRREALPPSQRLPGRPQREDRARVHAKHPERLIEEAVRGMLAANRMRDVQLEPPESLRRRARTRTIAQKPQPLF